MPVYDLSVEGEPEFFASGILVHNSWREGQHDDLVLALATACWVGENCCAGPMGEQSPEGRLLTAGLLEEAAPGEEEGR